MVPIERLAQMPLLPHEKQLIEALGLTAEEYSRFKQEVMWRSRVRPAEYEHIPEVQAEVVSIVTSLVIGVLFTAASYLLTPKPQQEAQTQSRVRNRQLDSIIGRDRFSPTYGFQGAQDLARYGEPIPIVFTRQVFHPDRNAYTGGLMTSPRLVWSRLFSWGTHQTADLIFLAGQARMGRGPYSNETDIANDRAGIYIGQTPLDGFSDTQYRWFYYQGGDPNANGQGYTGGSRLLGRHNRYGTLGQSFGDTQNAFYSPTFAGTESEGFSHSYAPNSQLRFGVYNGIPNGTPYRVNWEVISRLDDFSDEQKRDANAKRLQIAGNFDMKGNGRNYPRFIGIIESISDPGSIVRTANGFTGNNGVKYNDVKPGDFIKIVYNDLKLDPLELQPQNRSISSSRYRQGSVDNQSIITAIESELAGYDDVFQVNETFIIGNCLFRVQRREPRDYSYSRFETNLIAVFLICEEVFDDGYVPNGRGSVGVVHAPYIINTRALPEDDNGSLADIGQAWYPICQQEMASFQNIRKCSYTEIGIKSQVWLRFNGLANFTSVPGPNKLDEFDKRNIRVSTGSIQAYSTRYSFFAVYIRHTNNPTGRWARLNNKPLCIRGSAPRDIFSFLRIAHPPGRWEFRIRPITSGELVQIIGRDSTCLRLDAKEGFREIRSSFEGNSYILYTRGVEERIADVAPSSEMISGRRSTPITVEGNEIRVRLVEGIYRGNGATEKQISGAIARTIGKDPDPDASELSYGDVPWSGTPLNGFYTFSDADAAKFTLSAGRRSMQLRMTLQAVSLPGPYQQNREIWWRIVGIQPINLSPNRNSGEWENDQKFQITKNTLGNEPLTFVFKISVERGVRTINVDDNERQFEANAAISEVSHYGSLISRSCDSAAEHEIVYINESMNPGSNATYEGCAMAGLKIRSSRNLTALEQLHLYQRNGMFVERYMTNTDGTTESDLGVGPSNIFTDLVRFLLTNKQAGMGSIFSSELLDETSLRKTARFLEANRLYYDDVITEPSNIRDFVANIAPSLLCNMVMRNGKFSLEPALPYFNDGFIKQPNGSLPNVQIQGIFTDGNIIEDSFELRYLNAEERKPFKAVIRYRLERPNRFPEERTIVASYNDSTDWSNAPLEEFNFTHISSYEHAELAAKYFLSVRRNITHTVSFKTTPFGLALAPGDYIRVVTEQNIYNASYNNGAILEDGTVVSVEPLATNANHDVFIWDRQDGDVQATTIYVDNNGKVSGRTNAIFAVRNTQTSNQTYVVESLQLDEDGLVQIVASHFPVTAAGKSLIAEEITGSALFTIDTSA